MTVNHATVRVFFGVVALCAGAARVSPAQQSPREGTFAGSWQLEGEAKKVAADGEEVFLFRADGPVRLTTSTGMQREFASECVGTSDNETGGVGRCVWTDADGDRLVLSMAGEIIGPAGTFRESRGQVQSGTGKYQGAQGDYVADWLFLESTIEPGKITARGTELKGAWKRP